MEPIFVGWLSLLPPLLAISLALITKEVMSSLLIGILSGSLIYACASGLNPFMGTLTTTFDLMASRVDMKILIFLGLLGALVVVVTMAGGSRALRPAGGHPIRSKTATWHSWQPPPWAS